MATAARVTDEAELEVLRDPQRVSALLDPERRRLVEALRQEPDSAAGLARRLGESRQRLNYHLRKLEGAGLLELVDERRRGNFVERVLGVVARRFVVDPAALEGLADEEGGPEAAGDRFSSAYVVAQAARTIREVAALQEKAGREEKRLATAGLETRVALARPADFAAFVDDLSRAVAEVVARHHDEGPEGRWFRIAAGVHPADPAPRNGGSEDDDETHETDETAEEER